MTILCVCSRPMSAARKIADGVGQCPCGRKWYRVDWAQHAAQVESLTRYNCAMRNAKSRRKFVLTGRV